MIYRNSYGLQCVSQMSAAVRPYDTRDIFVGAGGVANGGSDRGAAENVDEELVAEDVSQ